MGVDGKPAENTAAIHVPTPKEGWKFCSVCKEWLCASCTKYHRRLKAAKTHALYYKDTASDITAERGLDNTTHYR